MATPGRVLVLSGSAGQGHVKAGEAVTAALKERHPALAVDHWDALTHTPRWFAGMYRSSYIRLVDRHPILWRWVYERTDRSVSWAGHSLSMLASGRLVADVAAWRPDVVLCTHFLAPEVLSTAITRGKLKTRLEIAVTDHDAHRNWWWPEVSHAYVASDLVAARFRLRYGMAPRSLSVTGIPVRADFGRPRDVAGARARYGLDPERPTVLFFSGGFVSGPLLQAVAGVWSERPDLQVLAVCGRNERLRRRVERLDRPDGAVLHALGFVKDVPDLMAVADIVVSKSGGLSTSECMALGRPMIISGHIAGQEERNADAVMAAGAGIRALSPEEVCWRIARLLDDTPAREAMAERALAFGRPHAAAVIADLVAAKVAPATGRGGPYFHGAR